MFTYSCVKFESSKRVTNKREINLKIDSTGNAAESVSTERKTYLKYAIKYIVHGYNMTAVSIFNKRLYIINIKFQSN